MSVSIKSPTSTTGSIQLNGSDVLTIDSSGNLTAPNNLTVTGTVTQTGGATFNGGITGNVAFDTNTLYVDATNNRVGIGTSSPASKLHIDQGTGGEGLRFERDTYDTMDIELSESGLRFRNETDGRTDLFLDGSGILKFNSGYGSAATAYGCRAWVNFNGTGTVAIRASGNVSSITDNGVGDYTINFTTAMPDTNYNVVASTSTAINVAVQGGVNLFYNKAGNVEVPPTTTAARIQPQSNGGTAIDPQYVCASIFR